MGLSGTENQEAHQNIKFISSQRACERGRVCPRDPRLGEPGEGEGACRSVLSSSENIQESTSFSGINTCLGHVEHLQRKD